MCGEIDQGCHLDLEVSWREDFNHPTDFFHRHRAIGELWELVCFKEFLHAIRAINWQHIVYNVPL